MGCIRALCGHEFSNGFKIFILNQFVMKLLNAILTRHPKLSFVALMGDEWGKWVVGLCMSDDLGCVVFLMA